MTCHEKSYRAPQMTHVPGVADPCPIDASFNIKIRTYGNTSMYDCTYRRELDTYRFSNIDPDWSRLPGFLHFSPDCVHDCVIKFHTIDGSYQWVVTLTSKWSEWEIQITGCQLNPVTRFVLDDVATYKEIIIVDTVCWSPMNVCYILDQAQNDHGKICSRYIFIVTSPAWWLNATMEWQRGSSDMSLLWTSQRLIPGDICKIAERCWFVN